MRPAHRLSSALLLICVGSLDAQTPVQGRVVDDVSVHAVAGATVILEDAAGRHLARQVTGSDGRFSFLSGAPGGFAIRVDRLGYRGAVLQWVPGEQAPVQDIEVRLTAEPVPLAAVEVDGRARSSPTLSGFEQRKRSGLGWYATREDFEKSKVFSVSNLLATAPGVRIQRRVIYLTRGGGCPAQIFVDGFHINRSEGVAVGRRGMSDAAMVAIDDFVRPEAVEGIEVYQGMSRLPAEFRTAQATCGVVAIWTRRGL
jgi:hypothetical protein